MSYSRKTHGIFTCLVKEGLDLHKFSYRFTTGRITKDYEIIKILGVRNLQEAFDCMFNFRSNYEKTLLDYNPSMKELYQKKWIFKNQVAKAKKIMKLL